MMAFIADLLTMNKSPNAVTVVSLNEIHSDNSDVETRAAIEVTDLAHISLTPVTISAYSH